jgi:dTDP-4-dehydrorhamnose reductase
MDGHRIVVIGRDGQLARELIALWSQPKNGVNLVVLARPEFDLLDPSGLAEAIRGAKPHLVVNAAAYTAVDKAEDDADAANTVNAVAPGVMAAAAHACGAPIIHVSTDYVFDGSKRTPYVETDPVAPLGVYGATKLAGERLVAAANPAHVILRTAWVCSPYGQNFVKTMLRLGAEREVLRVVNDQHGAPTFASDLASAIAAISSQLTAKGDGAPFGTFHVAGGGQTTWCEFARAIMAGSEARGRVPMARIEPISTSEYPTRATRPAYSKLATSKLSSAYDIQLPPWESALSNCLDHLIGPRHHDNT